MAQHRGMWHSKPAVDKYHLGFKSPIHLWYWGWFMALGLAHCQQTASNTIRHHQPPKFSGSLFLSHTTIGGCVNTSETMGIWNGGRRSFLQCVRVRTRTYALLLLQMLQRGVWIDLSCPQSPVIVFGIITRLFHGNDPNWPTNISDVLDNLAPKTKQKPHLTIDFLRGNPRSNDLLNGLCFQGKSEPS